MSLQVLRHLRKACRAVEVLPSLPASRAVLSPHAMPMSTVFEDREHAAEAVYFNKEEERLLRKLVKKMKSQADKVGE